MLIFTQSLLLMLAGAALYWAGRRGRRIDRLAVCRRCGFDLSARGPYDARCPECGLNLFSRRAIRRGRRAPMPLLSIAGAVVLLVGVLHALVWGVPEALRLNWNSKKPTVLLLAEARGTSGAMQFEALRELGARLERRTLDPDEERSLIDFAFERCESPVASLEREASFVVLDVARRAKALSDLQVQRSARAGLRLRLSKTGWNNYDRAILVWFSPQCASDLGEEFYYSLRPGKPTVTDAAGSRQHVVAMSILHVSPRTRDAQAYFAVPPPDEPCDYTISLPVQCAMFDARNPLVPICEWEETVTISERFP